MRTNTPKLHAWLPFMRWFPMSKEVIRADIIAGITVALLLIPQSMAYAQLAGLPVVYGLYASVVPVIIAAMWGSCNQLHTAPVAMLSMMSAAALIPFALVGTEKFIELAIMLGLMVGILRLLLGLGRLGVLVNFISNPVLVGFTNAAAIIIGFSQLSKIIGVPFPRSDSYLSDLWGVVAQIGEIHWATFAFAVGAYVLIRVTSKFIKRLPGVLIAVVLATIVSALVDFENKQQVSLQNVAPDSAVDKISHYVETKADLEALNNRITQNNEALNTLYDKSGDSLETAKLEGEIITLQIQESLLKKEYNKQKIDLYSIKFVKAENSNNYFVADKMPPSLQSDGKIWRFLTVDDNKAVFSSGGSVVGEIPQGLPEFAVPVIDFEIMIMLLPAAFIMALIGFMEATSISKAIAVTTKQRTDINKELVGQGLANAIGSFFSSYTVSGSFSRSAVAAKTGAQTGLFAIVSALAVIVVLLFLTPLLYHLPQAVLAVIVMMAVFGLIRIKPLIDAWQVDRIGALIGILAFIATLGMAPNIANGIMVGIVLTMVAFVAKAMKPRAEIQAHDPEGVLAGMNTYNLPAISQDFVPIRFDGALIFANVSYFENAIIEARSTFPESRTILIIGSGLNWIDASGEVKIREMVASLKDIGITLAFSSLKKQVRNSFERGDLISVIGADNIFRTRVEAIKALTERYEKEKEKNKEKENKEE